MLYLYITTLVALCNIEKVNKPYRYRLYNGFYGIEVYGALKSIESQKSALAKQIHFATRFFLLLYVFLRPKQ